MLSCGPGQGLRLARPEALGHDGPALVDVRTARHELSLPPKLTYGQIKGLTGIASPGGRGPGPPSALSGRAISEGVSMTTELVLLGPAGAPMSVTGRAGI